MTYGTVADDLLNGIIGFEGWAPRAKWDYRQWTNGYGTRARYPGEVIDRAEAARRLQVETAKAAQLVDGIAPNAPPGVRDALVSLTYNAGPGWMRAGLGQAVKKGNWG